MRLFGAAVIAKLKNVTAVQSAILIAILAVAVYCVGLTNQFLGDDISQIVSNTTVHSLGNIKTFFEGGTFYAGPGHSQLVGVYYRPLMTVVYSAIFSVAGPNPLVFHLIQLILHILCCIVLCSFLRFFFRPLLALLLALVFLVHPANSQAVFAIAAMQEPLFFLPGITAMWILTRYQDKSSKVQIVVALCLLISLLAKEAGILFVLVALLYVAVSSNLRRFFTMGALSLLVLAVYLVLKVNAVGLASYPQNGPIDSLSFFGRLLNAPAMLMFYLSKIFFPNQLANRYFWAYTHISFEHFLLPLLVVIVFLGLMTLLGWHIYRRFEKRYVVLYGFFAFWTAVGLGLHMQLIPLDSTVSESWLYFPIVGVLGMFGVIVEAFNIRYSSRWYVAIPLILIAVLGSRTAVRGFDWHDLNTLSYHDVRYSAQDYNSENFIAMDQAQQGDFNGARVHALRSLSYYKNANAYNTLGLTYVGLGQYAMARQAYLDSLKIQSSYEPYENLARLTLWAGDKANGEQDISQALAVFPGDSKLWLDLALLEHKNGDSEAAKLAISHARLLPHGPNVDSVYGNVTHDIPFTVTLSARPE